MGFFLFGSVFFNVSYITASVEISKGIIPEQYIVVLKDDSVRTVSEVADKMTAFHGIKVKHVYRNAIKGFSARIPDHKLEDLKRDPYVRLVDADRLVFAMSEESCKHKPREKENAPQLEVLPTGVNGVDAELNMISHPVDADIAILDTGIDLDHPDLNVVENVTFITSEREGDDDNGHGSHVAGIAAAIFIAHNPAHGIFISSVIVKAALINSGDYGSFIDDPDSFQEPLLNASGLLIPV
ncbi:MAG: S8 family serine peptidase [Candidatus Scalindua sp.]|nr:S8 family serine peptidase [Candidatus Scalindua sp.]